MASAGAIWGPAALRLLRTAVTNSANAVKIRLAHVTRPELVRVPVQGRQPIHPAAFLRQQRTRRIPGKWFSTASVNRVVRRFISSEPTSRGFDRSALYASAAARRVAQSSGRAPFASTLRPNLTGGAMPRTASGYGIGGGARYFSHGPAAPAQVVQNVSQAMRAFFLSGQKLRYDGLNAHGDRRYRAVSKVEGDAAERIAAVAMAAPGAYVDFKVSPTLTAMSPLAAAITTASAVSGFKAEAAAATLNTDGFLDVLSADFGRALKDLTAVYADLRRLAVLGDLPISMEKADTLRVRFPGVDAETLNRLCDDIGIQRGMIGQDATFDKTAGVPVALRFPFAPDADRTVTSPGGSVRSLKSRGLDEDSLDDDSFAREAFLDVAAENPWLESEMESLSLPMTSSGEHCSEDFEGLEGIYRFLEECDRGRGRLG